MKIKTKEKAVGTVARGLKVKSRVKAGFMQQQHNQAAVRRLKVKSCVNAGLWMPAQHNQTMKRGLKVKSGIKAGESNGDLHIGHLTSTRGVSHSKLHFSR